MEAKHGVPMAKTAQAAIMAGLIGAQLLFAGPALALDDQAERQTIEMQRRERDGGLDIRMSVEGKTVILARIG